MNLESTKLKNISKDSQALQIKEFRRFIFVMIVFTIGMTILLFYDVSAWWIWYIYFAIWTLIEYKIAKNINLKWRFWVLIILVIIAIDWSVLELIEYLKK